MVVFPLEFGCVSEARDQFTFLAWIILNAGEYVGHPMITEQEERAAAGQVSLVW